MNMNMQSKNSNAKSTQNLLSALQNLVIPDHS